MNKLQAIQWAVQNLPRWPTNFPPDTAPNGWEWRFTVLKEYILVSNYPRSIVEDGLPGVATSRDFHRARGFRPCGKTFNELMGELMQ